MTNYTSVNPVNTTYNTYYTYDLLGRMLTVKDALGLVTSYEYNIFDQPGKIIMPVKGGNNTLAPHQFTYDNRGNLKTANYGNGIITYKYDQWDQVKEIVDSKRKVTFDYALFSTNQASGRRVTAKANEGIGNNELIVGTVITETDPMGRLRLEQWGNTRQYR